MRAVDRVGIPTPFAQTVRRDVFIAPATLAQTNFALTSSVNMTSGGTAHTKGSWVELVASTADEIDRLLIQTGGTSAGGSDSASLMDIGVGAAGAEVVIIPDVMMGYAFSATYWDIPVAIPSGSRIAARYQSIRTSLNCGVQLVNLKRPNGAVQRPASYTVSIGTDTSTSRGVSCIPGASNAKGAWAQLTASCPVSLQGVQIGIGGAGNSAMQPGTVLVDIGIGAAGAETTIISNVQVATSTSENVTRNIATFFFFPVRVPLGARIAARCSNTGGTSGAYYVDVSLVGVPRSAP